MTRVAIVSSARSAFQRAGTGFAQYSSLDLSLELLNKFLDKNKNLTNLLEEVFFSTVLLDPRYPNLARELVLRSSLPKTVSAHFVSNNCISGLVTMNSAYEAILSGRIQCALAGGVESMSRPALMFSPSAQNFFLSMMSQKTLGAKLKKLLEFRPRFCVPKAPSPKEPSTGLTMGQHCEISAQELNISRVDQDTWALNTHNKAFKAVQAGFLSEEIIPIFGVTSDNLVRKDSSLEKLAKLKPVFDNSEKASITAGNASALTDGASLCVLASEEFALKNNLKILGFVEAVQFSALDPKDGLLMAPALALPALLKKSGISIDSIDRFEIHEAFAAQVLCNLKLWNEGWKKYDVEKIGQIPYEKINVNGGSLALGHPFAATGARLISSLLNELERSNTNKGAISVCAAGGMAGAVLLSRK